MTKGYLWAVVDVMLMGQPIEFDNICLLPTLSIPEKKEMIEMSFEQDNFLIVVEEIVQGSNCIVGVHLNYTVSNNTQRNSTTKAPLR